jgi:uncharacterized protein (DUF58 family)
MHSCGVLGLGDGEGLADLMGLGLVDALLLGDGLLLGEGLLVALLLGEGLLVALLLGEGLLVALLLGEALLLGLLLLAALLLADGLALAWEKALSVEVGMAAQGEIVACVLARAVPAAAKEKTLMPARQTRTLGEARRVLTGTAPPRSRSPRGLGCSPCTS